MCAIFILVAGGWYLRRPARRDSNLAGLLLSSADEQPTDATQLPPPPDGNGPVAPPTEWDGAGPPPMISSTMVVNSPLCLSRIDSSSSYAVNTAQPAEPVALQGTAGVADAIDAAAAAITTQEI